MSSYDIALVLNASALNSALTELFNKPATKAKLFQGTQSVGTGGVTSVQWDIGAAPYFVLSPPSQAQWNDPSAFFPGFQPGQKPATPSDQVFQVQATSITTTINFDNGDSTPLNFNITLFAQITVSGTQIQLASLGVLPTDASPGEQLILEIAAGVLYDQLTSFLNGYQIPSTITVEGFDFTPPVTTIANGYLIAATNLSANGTPDITGVTWPPSQLGVLVGRRLLAALLVAFNADLQQALDNATINYSDSNWTGSYKLTGGITDVSTAVGSAMPDVNVTGTFAATAELGVSWWLVPVACALESASNLL